MNTFWGASVQSYLVKIGTNKEKLSIKAQYLTNTERDSYTKILSDEQNDILVIRPTNLRVGKLTDI